MRRPIALTDPELKALVFVSNVALNDPEMWEEDGKENKRLRQAHDRANAKLRTEAYRRGWRFDR